MEMIKYTQGSDRGLNVTVSLERTAACSSECYFPLRSTTGSPHHVTLLDTQASTQGTKRREIEGWEDTGRLRYHPNFSTRPGKPWRKTRVAQGNPN